MLQQEEQDKINQTLRRERERERERDATTRRTR